MSSSSSLSKSISTGAGSVSFFDCKSVTSFSPSGSFSLSSCSSSSSSWSSSSPSLYSLPNSSSSSSIRSSSSGSSSSLVNNNSSSISSSLLASKVNKPFFCFIFTSTFTFTASKFLFILQILFTLSLFSFNVIFFVNIFSKEVINTLKYLIYCILLIFFTTITVLFSPDVNSFVIIVLKPGLFSNFISLFPKVSIVVLISSFHSANISFALLCVGIFSGKFSIIICIKPGPINPFCLCRVINALMLSITLNPETRL